jgi:hypothetical protein
LLVGLVRIGDLREHTGAVLGIADRAAGVVHRAGDAVAAVVVERDGAPAGRDHLIHQPAVVVELDLVAVAILHPFQLVGHVALEAVLRAVFERELPELADRCLGEELQQRAVVGGIGRRVLPYIA